MGHNRIVILGAGISGLTAAVKLVEAGFNPVVFELQKTVGGLAATIRGEDYDFDLGGHRWYSGNPQIDKFFRETVGPDLLRVPRYSRISFGAQKLFQYPIRFGDVVRLLGLPFGFKATLSLVAEKLKRRGEIRTAEQAYINNFGKCIYENFFKQYTERLWGIPCDILDGRWVGQRSDNLSLWKVVKGFLFKRKDFEAIDEFVYPGKGFGQFAEKMAEKVTAAGGRVVLGSGLIKWRKTASNFELEFRTASGETTHVTCEKMISTIPINRFIQASAHARPPEVDATLGRIRFRDFLVVALHLNQQRYSSDTWLYTQGKGVDFVRLHEPKNWSPHMVRRQGTTVVVLELPCWEGDCIWTKDEKEIADSLYRQMHLGVMPVTGDLLGFKVLRVKNVYPVYEVGYDEWREVLVNWLSTFDGLELSGRNGLFVYDSSDQPVGSGMEAAARIIRSLREAGGEQESAGDCGRCASLS
jgi:protoporphyrinogen oxidase